MAAPAPNRPPARPARTQPVRSRPTGGPATAAAPAPRRAAEASPAAAPRLRVVDDARLRAARRQRRARAVLVLGFLLGAALLFAVAACHAFLVSGQSRIDALQRSVAEEQARFSANRLEIDQLEAPERIVREAGQRLGMVPPTSVGWLTPSRATAEAVGAVGAETPPRPVPTSSQGVADVKRVLGGRP
jgi:hypothetical protein